MENENNDKDNQQAVEGECARVRILLCNIYCMYFREKEREREQAS